MLQALLVADRFNVLRCQPLLEQSLLGQGGVSSELQRRGIVAIVIFLPQALGRYLMNEPFSATAGNEGKQTRRFTFSFSFLKSRRALRVSRFTMILAVSCVEVRSSSASSPARRARASRLEERPLSATPCPVRTRGLRIADTVELIVSLSPGLASDGTGGGAAELFSSLSTSARETCSGETSAVGCGLRPELRSVTAMAPLAILAPLASVIIGQRLTIFGKALVAMSSSASLGEATGLAMDGSQVSSRLAVVTGWNHQPTPSSLSLLLSASLIDVCAE